ncbi:hypothetical protein NHX12_029951 [Muraenolepis orangiensis]|uniref:Uncharacterized protein n=1 Tax=Muraenolepis orangiensis TaxID=630683 RepID=A0A9Q0ECZ7_9TELE|nr:hypothetical protein NHX12_029951 [Muraenolepis orangiensis]
MMIHPQMGSAAYAPGPGLPPNMYGNVPGYENMQTGGAAAVSLLAVHSKWQCFVFRTNHVEDHAVQQNNGLQAGDLSSVSGKELFKNSQFLVCMIHYGVTL